jgi:hypothetical protein
VHRVKKASQSKSKTQVARRSGLSPRTAIPFLLLSVFTIQSLWFIRTQSLTYDEPAHVIAGIDAWRHGRFEHWNDHPPLGRLWLTLPMARADSEFAWQKLPTGFRVVAMQPGPEALALRTRPMNTLLGLALGAALWFAARRLFSEGSANVALALFVFTPSLIAHFSVATTDGIGTLFIFLTAFQLVRWRHKPSWVQTLIMGLVLGGLLLAKFYALPLVLLAVGLMLVLKPEGVSRRPSQWNWKPVAVVLPLALLMLWAGYFFHVSHLKIGDGRVVATFPHRAEKIWATKANIHVSAYIPAGEFVEGLREVAFSNKHGRPAWFLGKIYPTGGIKAYYPVAIALKWPAILLTLFLASLLTGVWRVCRNPIDLLAMCAFGMVFLIFAIQSKYDIGERHILPLYPFVLLIAGAIWERVKVRRAAIAFLLVLLALNAADALRCAPDYLTYFNVLVKPANSWRYLTDSNLDWGQGLIALREYEQKHPEETMRLAYFGTVDPALYGVRAIPVPPEQPIEGTVVAGASVLSGQILADPYGYRWLLAYPPQQMIDRSMFVFDTRKK